MPVVPMEATIIFSLFSHLSAGSSLTCMRTCSSKVFRVKFVVLSEGGLDLLSSLLSLVWADFLPPSRQGSPTPCFLLRQLRGLPY